MKAYIGQKRFEADYAMLDMPLIADAGVLLLKNTRKLMRRVQDFYSLLYVQKGEIEWQIESAGVLRQTGRNLLFIPPGARYGVIDAEIASCTLLWLHIQPQHPEAVRNSCFNSGNIETLGRTLDSIGITMVSAPPYFALAAAAVIRMLCEQNEIRHKYHAAALRAEICRVLIHIINTLESRAGLAAMSSPEVARAKAFIESGIDQQFSIEELCSFAKISRSALHAHFLKETGQTPKAYQQKLRIEKAHSLLLNSSLPIAAIALDLGYSSSQHFAAAFRKFHSLSPQAYRSANK